MGIFSTLKDSFSGGLNTVSSLAGSKAFKISAAVVLVGSLFWALFVPFATLLAYGIVAAGLAGAGLVMAKRGANYGLEKLKAFLFPNNSATSNNIEKENNVSPKDVSNGKDTGVDIVDSLVGLLRNNGLKVSTDWKAAKLFLEDLPDKYDHLKKNASSLGGFVYQGVIFINPKNCDASVPVHEYTHVWAEALRQCDADKWKEIVGLIKKETVIWEEVRKNYPHLETDDEIADEVLATYSGRHGQERLKEFTRDGDSVAVIFKNLLQALETFWKGVGNLFSIDYKSIDDIADKALYDMFNGFDPNKHIDHNKITLSDRTPLSEIHEEKPAVFDTSMGKDVIMDVIKKDGDCYVFPEFIPISSVYDGKLVYAQDVHLKDGEIFVTLDNVSVSYDELSAEEQLRIASLVDYSLYTSDVAIDDSCSRQVGVYQGPKALSILAEILDSERMSRSLNFPAHTGAKGFYQEAGKFVAFDNSSNSCWMEEFYSKSSALAWSVGKLSVEEIRESSEEQLAKKNFLFSESVKAVRDRVSDAASKSFSCEQRKAVSDYLNCFSGEEQRLAAANEVFSYAMDNPAPIGVYDEWKDDARNELNDLAAGRVRENPSMGVMM